MTPLCLQAGMKDEKLSHTIINEVSEIAFWKSLANDLCREPPFFAPLLNILKNIKTDLQQLCNGQSGAAAIGDLLDIEHLKERIKYAGFSFADCWRLVGGIMEIIVSVHSSMGMMERKEETTKKWDTMKADTTVFLEGSKEDCANGLCKSLEFVLDRIHKVVSNIFDTFE